MKEFIVLSRYDLLALLDDAPVEIRIDEKPFTLCSDECFENQIAEIRATDVAEITAFREKIDAEVEKTKQVGGRYIAYISWKVSQTAIEALAQEYRERGFEVGYDDDEVANRKYTRGFWLEWKNVGR